jgi:hypothetical protein
MATLEQSMAEAIAGLSANRPLTVLDVSVAGMIAFQVRLDGLGVPRVREVPDAELDSMNIPAGETIIVAADLDSGRTEAIRQLLSGDPKITEWTRLDGGVRALLNETIGCSPIRRSYELVLAHADSADNRIWLSTATLFPPGARRGATARLTIRSVCTDESGTVLAVVVRDGQSFGLLSADSVRLAPGTHDVEAKLCGPGKIQVVAPEGAVADGHRGPCRRPPLSGREIH